MVLALNFDLAVALSLALVLEEVPTSGLLPSQPGVSCALVVPDSGLNQQGAVSEKSQPKVDTIRDHLLDHRQTVILRVGLP